MRKLDDAIERQQAVQGKRTVAWAIFTLMVLVSLIFWLEVLFALGHLTEIGVLQLLAESLVALISTIAAVNAYRSGKRYNDLLADTSRFFDDRAELDQ